MQSNPDHLRTVRIAHGAMLLGSVAIAGAVAFVTSQDFLESTDGLEPLQWIAVLFAVVSIGPALGMRALLRKRAANAPDPAAFAGLCILPAALLEGTILFNLVVWLLTDSQWPNAVAALLPFVCSLALWLAGPGIDPKSIGRG